MSLVVKEKEIRYYKGKYKVEVITKGIRLGGCGPITWRVRALEDIELRDYETVASLAEYGNFFGRIPAYQSDNRYGSNDYSFFTTIPRLLWTHKRVSSKEASK
jgi:hypothetical protein